jgi:hypothetical protein
VNLKGQEVQLQVAKLIEATATYDVVSFPSEAPLIKSVAVADENPTSAKLNVTDREEFCQLMTTLASSVSR